MLIAAVAAAMGSVVYRIGPTINSEQRDPKNLIPWRTDLDSARREAIAAKKPLFIEFSAAWCPDCQQMQTQTWTEPDVGHAMTGFIPVQIDFDANLELVKQFDVKSIPALFVVDPAVEASSNNHAAMHCRRINCSRG